MTVYWLLIKEFFLIGLFAIGGGMASLPFLYDLADKYDWFTVSQLTDMVAVAESTPGPVGINMATYAGYAAAGVGGGVVASLALIMPSLLIALIVSRLLRRLRHSALAQPLLGGLRAAVAGLIAAIAVMLLLQAVCGGSLTLPAVSGKALILLALLTAAVFKFDKHPLLYILTGALAGVVFRF